METNEISRRSFLKVLTVAGAVVAAPSALTSIASAAGSADSQTAAKFVSVGKTSDFKVGEFKKVQISDDVSAYVARAEGDEVKFTALSTKCTHKGCEVLWLPKQSNFRCPCHGGLFDGTGKVLGGPPKLPLPTLVTKVDKGQVWVQI